MAAAAHAPKGHSAAVLTRAGKDRLKQPDFVGRVEPDLGIESCRLIGELALPLCLPRRI